MSDYPVIPRGSSRAFAIEALLHDPNPTHWPLYTIEDMHRYRTHPDRTRITAKFADRAVTFDQYMGGPVLGLLTP